MLKNRFEVCLLAVAFCCAPWVASAADDEVWRSTSNATLAPGQAWVTPAASRAFELDAGALKTRLERAPIQFTPAAAGQAPIAVTLPMPDGRLARFEVMASPVMAPELAAKFPELQTYAGQGVDDPAATVRFDITPSGLHAQILSPDGAVYIDPERRGDAQRHLAYYRRDLQRDAGGLGCLVPGNDFVGFMPAAGFLPAASGSMLRTYRLAVAATGEYTQFHGGTVAAGMSAIVTAINRVNGIFETELAIRLVLVANNNLVVYTSPGSDPYSSSSSSTLLGQNQSTLDAIIGDANYDIGHVVNTIPGGLGFLACVCLPGSKSRGCTGMTEPVGDAFYVDFLCHELAHQFGANHTFNGVNGSCNGNRVAGAAFEPGSGATILAYAGLCLTDDLQADSYPNFHSGSYDEIQFYTTVGFGKDCAVLTPTGNQPPTVIAGPSFIIPRSTPFKLTATGSDPNGDALTYCWEERDLGPAQALGSPDNGSSPLFRLFNPTTIPSRTIPRLEDLLNNISNPAEQLPTTSRTLSFRVTARDNRAGGGGVNAANMSVTVSSAAGPFVVTTPNTFVSWSGPRTVTWNVAGTSNAPVNAATVDILLSTNGGFDFPVVLATNTPNDGLHSIVLPNVSTATARIMVKGSGNIFFDVSDNNFTITSFTPMPLVAVDSIVLTAEGCSPTNGVVDPAETVTVQIGLRNAGTGSTSNLTATLLNLGGVTPLSPSQNYGVLAPGGAAVSRPFTFQANGSCGSNFGMRIQLLDGSNSLGTAIRTMTFGASTVTNTFENSSPITIPSRFAAAPYPSTIAVSGLGNLVTNITVTLSNLSHAAPDDLDVLLVGPAGQKVLLLSDVGSASRVTDVTLTFKDSAAGVLGAASVIETGSFKPSNVGSNENFDAPAPGAPYADSLSVFNGQDPNGIWSLYVWDDANQNSGIIANGWRLTFFTQSGFVCCTPPPPPAPSLHIARAGANAQLSFGTISNRSYRLEWTGILGTTNAWTSVPGAASVPGTDGSVTVTDTNAMTAEQRFYRVRVLP